MRFGLFGDIHANREAFEAVMTALSMEKLDRLFCLGDIVGLGANPRECLEIIRKEDIESVAGNHDRAVSDSPQSSVPFGRLDSEARKAALWTRGILGAQEKEFLDHLPLVGAGEGFAFVHGSLDRPETFIFLNDGNKALDCFRLMGDPLCFVAHSHVTGVFVQDGRRIIYSRKDHTCLEHGFRYIINVGSVGQPRDKDTRAAYCVYDSSEHSIVFKRVEYDIKEAQENIVRAGLPGVIAGRLAEGH